MLLKCGVGEDSSEPLDCREIQPVHSEGNQPWIFIERTDAKAETPILWPPDVKNWLIWEDPDAGKDWRQEEKGTIEDEMVEWHHWLNGHEFEQAPGVGDGQGSLVCYTPWGSKELDTTEPLNWTDFCLGGSGKLNLKTVWSGLWMNYCQHEYGKPVPIGKHWVVRFSKVFRDLMAEIKLER